MLALPKASLHPVLGICILVLGLAALATSAFASAEFWNGSYTEYRNDRWHFSLVVPDDVAVSVHEHPAGEVMLFIDPTGEFKFRVWTWPYTQLDVTLGREGTPSNAVDQPDHLEIVDVLRDDMFTVIFQKNGVRYVVSALPEHETWLIGILQTWQFTNSS